MTDSPLKPHHCEKLNDADDYKPWSRRFLSYLGRYDGYKQELLHPTGTVEGAARQSHIYDLLIATVRHKSGFNALTAVERDDDPRKATTGWQALEKHYLSAIMSRLGALMNELQEGQLASEDCKTFTSRLLNVRIEIQKAGEQVSDLAMRTYLVNGLRNEYQADIAHLVDRGAEMTLIDFVSKIDSTCGRVEKRIASKAMADATPAAFVGSASDPFGYQQPPDGQSPTPMQTSTPSAPGASALSPASNADLAHQALKSIAGNISASAFAAIQQALPPHQGNHRTSGGNWQGNCFTCGQPGHRSYECPQRTFRGGFPAGGRGRGRGFGGRGGFFNQRPPAPAAPQPQNFVVPTTAAIRPTVPASPTPPAPPPMTPQQQLQAQVAMLAEQVQLYDPAIYMAGEEDFDTYDDGSVSQHYSEFGGLTSVVEQADFGNIFGPSMMMAVCDDADDCPIELVPEGNQSCESAFIARDTRQLSCEDLNMSTLTDCKIRPLPSRIGHLVENCSGGTLPILTKILAAGIPVDCYTLTESSNSIRYVAYYRIGTLRARCPDLLPATAISHWSALPQNANQLTMNSFKNFPPVTLIASTPPCPAFSKAGRSAGKTGWDSETSHAFISTVNLTRQLYDHHKGDLTYIFENVPGIISFRAVIQSLGAPVMAKATDLGSTSRRDTALWTNGAPHSYLEEDMAKHRRPGPSVPEFLQLHGYSPEYQALMKDPYYWPKFVARPGSWAFSFQSDCTPGPGLILHNGEYVEPINEMREESMGMEAGATAAPGITAGIQRIVIGNAMDHNIAGWLVDGLYRYSNSVNQDPEKETVMLAPATYPDSWVVDGGATSSCSAERSDFVDYGQVRVYIRGLNLWAVGKGTVVLYLPASTGPRLAHVRNVLHVPDLRNTGVLRLFSQRACQNNAVTDSPTFLYTKGSSIMQFGSFYVPLDHHHNRSLYTLHTRILKPASPTPATTPAPASPTPTVLGPAAAAPSPPLPLKKGSPKPLSPRLWHLRAGHISSERLARLPHDCTGVAITPGSVPFCSSCPIAKAVRRPSGRGTTVRTNAPFSHVGCDIWCHSTASIHGYHYVLGFTDYRTRWANAYLMRTKDEAPTHLASYLRWVRNLHYNVEHIRCDSDTVFKGADWCTILQEDGIDITYSAPYTPSENGLAERTWGIVMTRAKAMLATSGLPPAYWEYAVLTRFYLSNRLWTAACNAVPFTELSREKPDLRMLRVWGCPCWVLVPPHLRAKMADKAWQGVFVGYSTDTRGWLVYNPRTRRAVVSKHVAFDETFNGRLSEEGMSVPPKQLTDNSQQTTDAPIDSSDSDEDTPAQSTQSDSAVTPPNSQPSSGTAPATKTPANQSAPNPTAHKATPLPNNSNGSATSPNPNPRGADNSGEMSTYVTPDPTPPSSPEEGRPRRTVRPPQRLIEELDQHALLTNTLEPDPYFKIYGAYLSATGATPTDPTTRKKALASEHREQWLQAEREELTALINMGTYVLVPLPPGREPITCKWVYKTKFNADGSVARFKARLVARGFSQIEGLDYEETFAPTAKFATIRLLLSLACSLGWPAEQADIDTAFLNADLEEDIYMLQPEGYEDASHPEFVCQLKKSLYGLKQAAYLWNQLLADKLKSMGYVQLKSDSSCFLKRDSAGTSVILAVYVDDILMIARNSDLIATTKGELKKFFKVKDLGPCKWILGIAVERNQAAKTLTLHQQKYIMDMAVRFGIPETAERKTPHAGGDATPATGELMKDPRDYRSLVGSLLYAAVATRPDVTECVSRLCRKIQAPTVADWKRAVNCLTYLVGTAALGIQYSGERGIVVYCDSSHGSPEEARLSRSGYAILLNNAALSWRSVLQKSQALSSAEAEYMALCAAVQDAMWLRQMLLEMGMPQDGPTPIMEDNTACIGMATRDSVSQRVKHIDIRYHFVRDMIRRKKVTLVHCPTIKQAADILTKPTDSLPFAFHRATLMGLPASH